jgi:hypothetical protein
MAHQAMVCRTNGFRVNDIETFTQDLLRHGIAIGDIDQPNEMAVELDPQEDLPEGSIQLFAPPGCEGWPCIGDADEVAESIEDTFYTEIRPAMAAAHAAGGDAPLAQSIEDLVSNHLHPDDVAVFISSGHEKYHTIFGEAVAINSNGDRVIVSLEDIYDRAAHLGENISWASL